MSSLGFAIKFAETSAGLQTGSRVALVGGDDVGMIDELGLASSAVAIFERSEKVIEAAREKLGTSALTRQVDWTRNEFLDALGAEGPFDTIIVDGVLDQIHLVEETIAGLVSALSPGGSVVLSIRNGFCCQNVLAEPLTKKIGLVLLPTHEWPQFTDRAPRFFYRSLALYQALFAHAGAPFVGHLALLDEGTDVTKRHMLRAFQEIKRGLKPDNFDGVKPFRTVRLACLDYIDRATRHMDMLGGEALFALYRAKVWNLRFSRPALMDA